MFMNWITELKAFCQSWMNPSHADILVVETACDWGGNTFFFFFLNVIQT